MRRKKLVNPGVKYPKSKLVREALIPKRKREHTYTTCACGNVDYKTLVYLAKNSIRVIDNLAKTLASMEEKFDETKMEELCEAFNCNDYPFIYLYVIYKIFPSEYIKKRILFLKENMYVIFT